MSTDELLKALNIAPKSAPETFRDDFSDTPPADATQISPTALTLDDWSIRRGRDVAEQSERLRDVDPLAVADFHAAAFEPTPELAARCADTVRGEFMKQLLDTPAYQALHADTALDDVASEIAAAHFAEQYGELCEAEENAKEKARKDGKDGKPADGDGGFQSELRALGAASRATQEAAAEVGEYRDCQEMMGLGGDGSNGGGGIPPDKLRERFEKIRNHGTLRRIAALAGRYRRLAQQRQRSKPTHGQDDMVGTTLDNDLGRILPHELAMLAEGGDLELDAMRRFVERQLLSREYRSLESEAKGPIVVVVDESGSMNGDKICNAKALALALAWIARHQRRWCCLVGFAGGTEGNYLTIPVGQSDDAALLDWLTHFYSGGTRLDVPLVELPAKWEELGCPAGKTDVIVITDAIVSCGDSMKQDYNAWRNANKVRQITIVVGHTGDAGDIADVSDRVYMLPSIDVESDAVAETLSI